MTRPCLYCDDAILYPVDAGLVKITPAPEWFFAQMDATDPQGILWCPALLADTDRRNRIFAKENEDVVADGVTLSQAEATHQLRAAQGG